MKPTIIGEPSVIVPGHVCASLGPVIARVLADLRRDHVTLDPDSQEAIDKLRLVGAAWANQHLPPDLPSIDTRPSAPVQWISVIETASQLGRTTRAVTDLLIRGSLRGEKVGRTWRVDATSVSARKARS
jgi:excisionase family DNA binding protein